MAVIEGWVPPTRENYDFILHLWTFYPLVLIILMSLIPVSPYLTNTHRSPRCNG